MLKKKYENVQKYAYGNVHRYTKKFKNMRKCS